MLLNQYFEFVYLTKQLINNKLNLNLDIKLKIWEFYKKLIAVDIIKNLFLIIHINVVSVLQLIGNLI